MKTNLFFFRKSFNDESCLTKTITVSVEFMLSSSLIMIHQNWPCETIPDEKQLFMVLSQSLELIG